MYVPHGISSHILAYTCASTGNFRINQDNGIRFKSTSRMEPMHFAQQISLTHLSIIGKMGICMVESLCMENGTYVFYIPPVFTINPKCGVRIHVCRLNPDVRRLYSSTLGKDIIRFPVLRVFLCNVPVRTDSTLLERIRDSCVKNIFRRC